MEFEGKCIRYFPSVFATACPGCDRACSSVCGISFDQVFPWSVKRLQHSCRKNNLYEDCVMFRASESKCDTHSLPGEWNFKSIRPTGELNFWHFITPVYNSPYHYKDLNSLQEWSNKWQLRFNATKCKVAHLGYSNKHFAYQMVDSSGLMDLESTCCEKDLGVYVDTRLNLKTIVRK